MSVVLPVKDGERHLEEVLEAVAREGVDETLVIDSGSRDGSVALARSAGVTVLEIPPAEFGHGRTRNLGFERTAGDLVCMLTQDATPVPGWRAAYREAFSLSQDVGAAYGPHVQRAGTSPMVARELTEFFATFSPDGTPVIQRAGDPTFLSNVNACYARGCWEEIRFRDVPYAEDQAFGADLLAAGWSKVYHPGAAVLHAHDYGLMEFMRRYFDEYRGLRETIGYVQPFGLRSGFRHVLQSVRGDRRWMQGHGVELRDRTRWTVRSMAHHGGRQVFSALGSHAEWVPPRARRLISLERRDGASVDLAQAAIPHAPSGIPVGPRHGVDAYDPVRRLWTEGAAPLLEPVPGMADRERLRIAMIIPGFRRGSGGHALLFQIFSRLEQRGHVCSVWVHDYTHSLAGLWPGVLRHDICEFFSHIDAPVYKGFDAWHGADVAIATGWQTVHPALLLNRCHARAYLVNDHEPEFYATSFESALAEDTYRRGLHCIAGSPWLRDLLHDRYRATADAFEYGVDQDVYQPRPVRRRRDTVVYYARMETPRRAVPLGLQALAELHRRRPQTRILLFGTEHKLHTGFPHEHLGILDAETLSWLYSSSTVGLSLSMTNFSLIPKEMLACGLPCVELAGASAESIVGARGALELAPLNSVAIADALQRLLDDERLWERRSREGIALSAAHTWESATDQVEAGLRHALRLRELEFASR